MKKKYIILLFCICSIIMTGCSDANENTGKDNNSAASDGPINTATAIKTYEAYTGLWTENGISHSMLISEGGSEFSITITNGNKLDGYFYSQQGTSERIAEIDNITATIENNECYYDYTDDGFGGSGTLHIQFSDNKITIEVLNYHMDDNNTSGFGISGVYQLTRTNSASVTEESTSEMTEQDLLDKVYEKYYSHWPEDKMTAAIAEKSKYRDKCSFYQEVENYMVNEREVKDISSLVEPLYYTDMKYYKKEDFENLPLLIIYLAKNEIYARHGYIFKDNDLYNYFMGQLWYEPSCTPEDFNDSVFNAYEKANLKLLTALDKYK